MCGFDDIFDLYWDDKKGIFKLYDKQSRTRDLVLYQLDRTQQIFVWDGLPKTIPQHNIEILLQIHGNACITEVNNNLYAFFGGLGGEPNVYYEPTIYTVSNPYLNFSDNLKIDENCIRVRNDTFGIGLLPMFVKYASMLNENEISMNMVSICHRIDNLISADDDRTYESAIEYFNDIVAGQFGVISSSEFFDGIRNDATGKGTKSIKDLIEYEQYLKASWYNEIGLNSNYNMKRERIVASEAQMTDDALIPLVDNMLDWRIKACEEMKEMYGDRYDLDNLSVKLNPIWDLDKMYVGLVPEDISERSESSEDIQTEDNQTEDIETEDIKTEDIETEDNQTEDIKTEDNGTDDKVINIDINISTDEVSNERKEETN